MISSLVVPPVSCTPRGKDEASPSQRIHSQGISRNPLFVLAFKCNMHHHSSVPYSVSSLKRLGKEEKGSAAAAANDDTWFSPVFLKVVVVPLAARRHF